MTLRRSLILSTALAGLLATAASRPAQAQSCDPSRLMIILDQSSSMVRNSISGQTLWQIAVGAMNTLTTNFQTKLQMGLMKFPSPNECSPGSVFVSPALNTKAAIMAELGTPPPDSGNYTPMYQTLNAAESIPELSLTDVPNYVVLITDGWQWCSSNDPAGDRTKPINEVTQLAAMGITTYVVGFGGSVDTQTLNGMAVAGGTAKVGCNPSNSSPTASNNCYYQADNPAGLLAALTDIANNASAETCDGLDNDCDSKVDENLTQNCSTDCGSGTEICVNGEWMGCDAPQPEPEVCDGEDNNCDNVIDPGCDCIPGESRECGETEDTGVCQPGTQSCGSDAKWSECEGSVGPGPEECDGEDDDCDGLVDEEIYEGEVSFGLCGPGFECVNGDCEPVDPSVPPEDNGEGEIPALDDGGTAAGCGCQTSMNGVGGMSMGLMVVFGLAMVLRRRRVRQ